jgi:ATP phosphoribosyltransferase regulatory subunit
MSAWVLPDHIADVLPSEARHIEELRRLHLDTARSFGYELVLPPMLEHLESLLSGGDSALDLQTFKLVDQLSGRMLGLRADTTSQVARIDAHLLNRSGVTRLCYCGSVVRTQPDRPFATREPLQFGAEIYGHSGIEADLEVIDLALSGLKAAGLKNLKVDLSDARILPILLNELKLDSEQLNALHDALAVKDSGAVRRLTHDCPVKARDALLALLQLYGEPDILVDAKSVLSNWTGILAALTDLQRVVEAFPDISFSLDLADLRGYDYYSGLRFAVYVPGASDALLRGGRYDEVGAVFGRKRPAVGFSLDLKELVCVVPEPSLKAAIRAPWSDAPGLREAVASLRNQGETVVCVLPGHESQVDEFDCDRELQYVAGRWIIVSL